MYICTECFCSELCVTIFFKKQIDDKTKVFTGKDKSGVGWGGGAGMFYMVYSDCCTKVNI